MYVWMCNYFITDALCPLLSLFTHSSESLHFPEQLSSQFPPHPHCPVVCTLILTGLGTVSWLTLLPHPGPHFLQRFPIQTVIFLKCKAYHPALLKILYWLLLTFEMKFSVAWVRKLSSFNSHLSFWPLHSTPCSIQPKFNELSTGHHSAFLHPPCRRPPASCVSLSGLIFPFSVSVSLPLSNPFLSFRTEHRFDS